MKVYEIWPFGKPMFIAAKSKKQLKEAFGGTFPIYVRTELTPEEVINEVITQAGRAIWHQKDLQQAGSE